MSDRATILWGTIGTALISAAPVNGLTDGYPGTFRRGGRKHSKPPRAMMESEGLA